MSVVVFHFDGKVLPGGFLGVDVFFVLSGYLIATGLLREYSARGTIGLKRFWFRRLARLLPPLVAVLIVCLVLGAVRPVPGQASPPGTAVFVLGYISNWYELLPGPGYLGYMAHAWSLGIEEQFYVVIPLCLLFLLPRLPPGPPRLALGLSAAATSAAVRGALYAGTGGALAHYSTPARFDGLLLGVTAAVLLEQLRDPEQSPRWRLPTATAQASGASCLVGLLLLWRFAKVDAAATYYLWILLAGLLTVVIVGLVARQPHNLFSLMLGTAFLPLLGRLSYSLYLVHFPLSVLLSQYRLSAPVRLLLGIGGSLVLAALLHSTVELPALRWRHRHQEGRDLAPNPETSAAHIAHAGVIPR